MHAQKVAFWLLDTILRLKKKKKSTASANIIQRTHLSFWNRGDGGSGMLGFG